MAAPPAADNEPGAESTVDPGIPGASTRREFERRKQQREQRIERFQHTPSATGGERKAGDQEQEDEGNRREQRVKGQGAGKKRNVVFISGLQGTAEEAGG